MADTAHATMSFRWHDLPVELQDMVLDALLGYEFCHTSPDYGAWLSVKHYPLWNILAVSRDIRARYEKRIVKPVTLVFRDHENFNFTLIPLPVRLSLLTRAEVRMLVVCDSSCPKDNAECQAANDLSQTITLTAKVKSQLPNLSSLRIVLGIWWTSSERLEWPSTPHHSRLSEMISKLVEIPKLEEVAVFRAKDKCLDSTLIDQPEKLLVSWNRDTKVWKAADTTESDGPAMPEVTPSADESTTEPVANAAEDLPLVGSTVAVETI